MEYATTPGERLKRIRHTLGLSQEELADRIDYEKSSIGNAECGRTRLSNHLIVSLVKKFNVNVEYLLEGHGEMFVNTQSDEHMSMVMDQVLEAWVDAIQRIRIMINYKQNKNNRKGV